MDKKPNIVLLFADDLGIGDVSAFNPDAQFETENIDKLAGAGIKFTDSHATSALCTPSRYGLLTGRYNWRSRLKSSVIPGDSEPLIEKDRETIAHLLKNQGYHTAAVGKWHLGLEWQLKDGKDYEMFGIEPEDIEDEEPKYQKGREGRFGNMTGESFVRGLDIDYEKPITFGPNDLGFDYFYGTPASLDQGPFVIVENDKVVDQPINISGNSNISRVSDTGKRSWELGVQAPEHSPYHVPEQMQEKALEIMEENLSEDQPFFLYYPSHLVHGPLLPQDRFKGKSGVGLYGDFVLQLDSYVGELMEKLKEHDAFDNTIFIFTSDNGVSSIVGLDDLKEKGHDSSAGYRGHKMQIWEGGHREPTIISYPEMIEGGQTSNHMISHGDLYATLADFFDVEIEDEEAEDSISNLSLWKGLNDAVRKDIIHTSGNGGFSIRRGFWKLILVEDGGMKADYERETDAYKEVFRATELYDLRDDLTESYNVIAQHPDIVAELTEALADYVKEGRSTPGERQNNQPDLPTGDWEQLAWMEDYEDYIEKLNESYLERHIDTADPEKNQKLEKEDQRKMTYTGTNKSSEHHESED